MAVMKRLYAAGGRAAPIPAHGGMYAVLGESGFWWVGQGPRPAYRPTRAELVKAGIDPARFAAELLRAGGPDLTVDLVEVRSRETTEDRRPNQGQFLFG